MLAPIFNYLLPKMSRKVRSIMPSFSIRFEESQLLDLAGKARLHCIKKGYLLKSDPKLKKLSQRWCCVYHNFFFFYESESVPKPLGVIVLEGCVCKPQEQVDQAANEGAFSISISSGKSFYFVAQNQREKLEWIQALDNSSMSQQQQELQELRARCEEYSHIISTKNSEVSHLREVNRQAEQNIDHLHGTLYTTTPRHQSLTNSIGITTGSPDSLDHKATVNKRGFTPIVGHHGNILSLQRYLHGWYLRQRWRKIVLEYMHSPLSEPGKQRNQLIWKFVASEEDYVSQLTVLNEEYKQHLEMATASRRPLLSLQQFNTLFRNSAELLLLHQLFLSGLHSCLEKWPVIVFGNILKLFVPIFSIYHKFICDQSYASEVLFSLQSEQSFKEFLGVLESRPACTDLTLESLLEAPLKRLSTYVKDLQELCAHTPPSHVDYGSLSTTVDQLESIIKMIADEGGQSEVLRQVLKVEGMVEGGCRELLDKDQALIKQGILQNCEERATSSSGLFTLARSRTQQWHCFLFTKHLLITNRIIRKPNDVYRIVKILQLSRCHVSEYQQTDCPELTYCGVKVECTSGDDSEQTETILLLASNVKEKAEWIADITQCVENEKQNKVLQSQSIGLPVELSSRFIRYSTFKTGKEQLVNSGKLDHLLERLVKISCFGHNFLNTFLLSFPFYTDADTVFSFLEKSLWDGIRQREKRRGSITPQDAIRDARVIQSQALVKSPIMSAKRRHYSSNLSVPARRWNSRSVQSNFRKYSDSFPNATRNEVKSAASFDEEAFAAIKISFEPTTSAKTPNGPSGKSPSESLPSVAGTLFALKQWICKHYYHFKNDPSLSKKLEDLLEKLQEEHLLTSSEKTSVAELCHIYETQKDAVEELSPIMALKLTKEIPHLPSKPFESLLLWSPRATAEQLCLIEGALFQRVTNGEIMRYFSAKGAKKSKVSPNLAVIFEHFNRMSLFFMWSIPNQRYFVDRTNIIQFLIEVGWECYQLHNFSSVMQLTSALEHGSVSRFKHAWEDVPKNFKQQFRQLVQLSSTEGRFKELRAAMKKATPPSVPYLGILLSEISGVVEGAPTYLDEDKLINFGKMRRCVRLITMAMQHQKEPYEFNFIPQISKVLLHHTIPGNEDDLYKKVDEMEKNGELNPMPSS